jgi:hypothetical protein
MATKMKMVKKGSKMVPAFAADGKGKMKTGGMVNSNSKVNVSTIAKGKVGGTSIAPTDAVPKGKYGMSMKSTAKSKMGKGGAKPKAMYGTSMKPGMMKKGGSMKKAC